MDVGGYFVHYPKDSTWVARSKREVFIIENAPRDSSELLRIIQENEEFAVIDRDHIERHFDTFHRFYYRESWDTPIDFKEKKGKFNSDLLENHTDDLICKIAMYKGGNYIPDSLKYRWSSDCLGFEVMD